jgi:hypothetical protein
VFTRYLTAPYFNAFLLVRSLMAQCGFVSHPTNGSHAVGSALRALLRNQMWDYPALIVILIAFIVYQGCLIALKPTGGLIALTVIDIAITALTWREWRKQRHLRAASTAAGRTYQRRA